MIGTLPGHETLLGETAGIPVLQRQLHRRLDRFRAARGIHDMCELRSAARQQQTGQLLERVAGKEVTVTTRHFVKLRGDRRVDLAITVTDAKRGGAARAIQIPPTIGVINVAPRSSPDARQRFHPPANCTICSHAPTPARLRQYAPLRLIAQPQSSRGGTCITPLRYSIPGVRSRAGSNGPSRSMICARCATTMPGAMASDVPAIQPTMIS